MRSSGVISLVGRNKPRVRVRVYVDGLNFYNNVVKPFDIKWLDAGKLLVTKLARHYEVEVELERLVFFTSMYIEHDKRSNQEIYFKALKKTYGEDKFKLIPGKMTIKSGRVKVMATKENVKAKYKVEKKTDVALGVEIINDAHQEHGSEFDVACLVSNDMDMEPIVAKMIDLGKGLVWICPRPDPDFDVGKTVGVNQELARLVDDGDQITTGFTEEELARHRLPAKVGKHFPPDHAGWGIEP